MLAQQNKTKQDNLNVPTKSEADHFLVIKEADDAETVVSKIIEISQTP